tara:strand:+ start:357 stop:479 length:123 start_codon:yes stop_codon:yes gene_type:complete
MIPLIERILNEEGIDIPLPQWDLYLDEFTKNADNKGVGSF